MTIPRILSQLDVRRFIEEPEPARDWHALLVVFGVVAAMFALVAVADYQHSANVLQTQPSAMPSATASKQPDLKEALDTRTAEQEKYRQGTYTYADPSL